MDDSTMYLLHGPEEWRPIPGHAGYEASSWGRVRSVDRAVEHAASHKGAAYSMIRKGKVLSPYKKASGHLMFMAGRDNHLDVHVAVALAFLGEKPIDCEVLHLDHKPSNNIPENLKWGTRSENLRMDYRRGVKRRHQQKISQEQVEYIRAVWPTLTAKGDKAALAARLGVSESCVGNIASGIARRHG